MRTPDLWTFALACYARPGVETACLELQNQGADVCLLLCGAWLQARGVACSARLQALTALAAPWRGDVIEPLRGCVRHGDRRPNRTWRYTACVKR